jgi:hypothetical protein
MAVSLFSILAFVRQQASAARITGNGSHGWIVQHAIVFRKFEVVKSFAQSLCQQNQGAIQILAG